MAIGINRTNKHVHVIQRFIGQPLKICKTRVWQFFSVKLEWPILNTTIGSHNYHTTHKLEDRKGTQTMSFTAPNAS